MIEIHWFWIYLLKGKILFVLILNFVFACFNFILIIKHILILTNLKIVNLIIIIIRKLLIINVKLTVILSEWFLIKIWKWILYFWRLQTWINRIVFVNTLLIIYVVWELRLWFIVLICYFLRYLWKRIIFIIWSNSFFLLFTLLNKPAFIIIENLLFFYEILNLFHK